MFSAVDDKPVSFDVIRDLQAQVSDANFEITRLRGWKKKLEDDETFGRMSAGPQWIAGISVIDGTITADKITVNSLSAIKADMGTITAGTITFNSAASHIKSGQTAYDTGTGFWIGNDAGTPKVSFGNSAGSKVTWNGTTLAVTGTFTVGAGSSAGGWVINSTTITSASNNITLDSAGTITAGTSNSVASMSGAGTIRFWAGHATAASAPFQVSQAGAVIGTSFSSHTVAGTLAAGQNLGANDITIASTGKIKFGTSAADYLSNDILHFEVSNSEEAVIEWKNAANTPYGRLSGMASSSQADGWLYADYNGTILGSHRVSASSTTADNITASFFNSSHAAYIRAWATSSSSGVDFALANDGIFSPTLSLAETNRAASFKGRIYPGTTGAASQSTDWIEYNTTLGAMTTQGPFYPGLLQAGASVASGVMPSATKAITIKDGVGNTRYIPIYTAYNGWAA